MLKEKNRREQKRESIHLNTKGKFIREGIRENRREEGKENKI